MTLSLFSPPVRTALRASLVLGLALCGRAAAQGTGVPVEASVSAPASGWTPPVEGEAVTVRVAVGQASAPVAVRFVGFKLFYDPAAYTFVGRTTGALLSGTDLDDSDGTSDGLLLLRHDTNVYGSGRNAVSFSVALFDGAPLIQADGRSAVDIALRVRAGAAAERYTVTVAETELRDAPGDLVASAPSVVRRVALPAGDPPATVFPEVGGLTVDVSALAPASTLTVRRSEETPTGTALAPTYVAAGTGSWTLSLDPAATAFTADVCVPYAYATTAAPAATLVLQQRAGPTRPWVPLATQVRPSAAAPEQVCATVTEPGELVLTAPASAVPVELTAFSAVRDGVAVVLRWTTASETDNAGFGVEERVDGRWRERAFVPGHGTTSEAHVYTHRLAAAGPGARAYRLRQVDRDGTSHATAAVEVAPAQGGFDLAGPSPQPVSGRAVVRFHLPAASAAHLALYDLTGRRVAVLAEGGLPEGPHEATLDVRGLAPGVYLLRLTARGATATTRVVVAR